MYAINVVNSSVFQVPLQPFGITSRNRAFLPNLNQQRRGNNGDLVQTYPVLSIKNQVKYEILLYKQIIPSIKPFRIFGDSGC